MPQPHPYAPLRAPRFRRIATRPAAPGTRVAGVRHLRFAWFRQQPESHGLAVFASYVGIGQYLPGAEAGAGEGPGAGATGQRQE